MNQIQSKLRVLALAAGSLAISMVGANAANSSYTAGDLVLFFQQDANVGNSKTVYVDLGSAATVFRGTALANAASNLSLININTQLTSAFGSGWASLTNLYVGAAGFYGTSATSTTLLNGDPQRTLYVGTSRTSVGTLGSPSNAGAYDLSSGGSTSMTTAASNISGMLTPFADASGANGFNAAAIVADTSIATTQSNIASKAPVNNGVQGTAFNVFTSGVQQVGTAGTWASSFGSVSNVEFALDLNRIQARSDVSGQIAGGTNFVGGYEGTITVNSSGVVGFQAAVPEPSTYALFGISALGIGFVVARRRKIAVK